MKQYCRYCYGCIEGDCYYCTVQDRVLSEASIKRPNQCKDFEESTLGDIITGRQYTPRAQREKLDQIRMEV